jgi:hypothetical protein
LEEYIADPPCGPPASRRQRLDEEQTGDKKKKWLKLAEYVNRRSQK